MSQAEWHSLQLSPDDVVEIKHGSLRVSKLQKAIDQALQKIEPQFVQQLDQILQSMGVTPGISGGGTWMITDPETQRGLPMQYLQVQGEGWNHGLISLSIKIEVKRLADFIQARILDSLKENPVESQQGLLKFIDLAIQLLQPGLGTSAACQNIKSAYDKLNVIRVTISEYQPEEITEEKIHHVISKSLAILGELGCVFPDRPEQTVRQVNTVSPLDDIRQSLE